MHHISYISRKRLTQIGALVAADILLISTSIFLALCGTLDFHPSALSSFQWDEAFIACNVITTIVTLIFFVLFKLYTSLWEYAGQDELLRIVLASLCSAIAQIVFMKLLRANINISFNVLYALFLIVTISAFRFIFRYIRRFWRTRDSSADRPRVMRRTMLVGAGAGGSIALREMQQSVKSENEVACIIDDDPDLRGMYLRNVKIVGGRDDIVEMAQKYQIEEIVFAIPSATTAQRAAILEICSHTAATLKAVPPVYKLLSGDLLKQIKNVEIEDLLSRPVTNVDNSEVIGSITGKRVLVTGGGGSIGSELCRQLAACRPEDLIIFEIYENSVYDLQQELLRKYPDLNLHVIIGSVRDNDRVRAVFDRYRPELIFHAAAHKHVPLMEVNPAEAIKNNVFGTYNVAKAAEEFGAARFLMVSTDKAVNPTNIMGASKRICEIIVQALNPVSKTDYVAVRFGNVLGSNGSVIPLFRKQIAVGGPVTVTHKEVTRFFMTIPEAVSLILQAGSFAKGGEVFVLDMGTPVKIDDMARRMIKLSGFEPDVDIPIKYVGLRPGEKLFEELLMDTEGLERTKNNLIFIGHPPALTIEALEAGMAELRALDFNDSRAIKQKVAELVDRYQPDFNN